MDSENERMSELKAFDETKGGVKALVDSGITKVPRIFHSDQVPKSPDGHATKPLLGVPTIDLGSIEDDPVLRRSVAEKVVDAAASYGFFQVVNQGIPEAVLEEMIEGVRRFYEQDVEIKKQWYTRDLSKTVAYYSNYSLFTVPSIDWRDTTIGYYVGIRKASEEGGKGVIFELVAEGLNLEKKYLNEIGCSEEVYNLYHYYPTCPEPHLIMGGSSHSDINFLTLLLQDNLGGLQCFYDGHWLDLPPHKGALIVNVGDLLQLITNDKLKSPLHRVGASEGRARISIASFFSATTDSTALYGLIEELLSDDNPPKYRKTTYMDYAKCVMSKKEHHTSALLDLML